MRSAILRRCPSHWMRWLSPLIADIFGLTAFDSLARTAWGHPTAALATVQVTAQQHAVVASTWNASPFCIDFLPLFYDVNSHLESFVIDDLQFRQIGGMSRPQ